MAFLAECRCFLNNVTNQHFRKLQQAVEEKYKLCDESLSKLLRWISDVEDRISSQDVIHEVEEELRNQINTMKQIKDDLEQHSGQVSHCGDQVRQLVLTAGKSQLIIFKILM